MATRAVHIEAVSELSITAFLLSLHRFTGIRGLPAISYSDCGTNFISASHHLGLADDHLQAFARQKKTRWIFNPPRAPHPLEGIWEVAVKAAKFHLVRVIGNTALSFEEYAQLVSLRDLEFTPAVLPTFHAEFK